MRVRPLVDFLKLDELRELRVLPQRVDLGLGRLDDCLGHGVILSGLWIASSVRFQRTKYSSVSPFAFHLISSACE